MDFEGWLCAGASFQNCPGDDRHRLTIQKVAAASDGEANQVVRELLQEAASFDLGDWFDYTIGPPVMDLEAAPYGPEQENIRLREENARLRRLLSVHSIPIPQLAPENPPLTKSVEPAPPVDKAERARKRIALFRSLFRGREDVYARRSSSPRPSRKAGAV